MANHRTDRHPGCCNHRVFYRCVCILILIVSVANMLPAGEMYDLPTIVKNMTTLRHCLRLLIVGLMDVLRAVECEPVSQETRDSVGRAIAVCKEIMRLLQ